VIGRWVTPDPEGQYWSPYASMSNNPVNNVDPDGGWDVGAGIGNNLRNTFRPVLNALGKGFKNFGNAVLDGAQFVLDIAGMVPVLGAIPDLVNAGISALRGNWGDASVSLFSAIPGIGDVAGATKIGAKVVGAVATLSQVVKGSTVANRRGQQLHKLYKALEHNPAKKMYKEYTGLLKKYGIKPDFVDFNTKTIYDLKPNNPKKFREHEKQLENYRKIFDKEFGGGWQTVIDRY
jgi:hypothetical protein